MHQSKKVAAIPAPPLYKVVLLQVVLLLIFAAVLVMWDVVAGYSALLGGVIAIGPQAYHSWQAFRYRGARATADVVRAQLRGSAGKFLLTGALFAGVFVQVRPLNAIVLMAVYVAMIVVHVAATSWVFCRSTPKTISGNE